jgi:hypothetical protein
VSILQTVINRSTSRATLEVPSYLYVTHCEVLNHFPSFVSLRTLIHFLLLCMLCPCINKSLYVCLFSPLQLFENFRLANISATLSRSDTLFVTHSLKEMPLPKKKKRNLHSTLFFQESLLK